MTHSSTPPAIGRDRRFRIPSVLNAVIIGVQLGAVFACFVIASRPNLGWYLLPLAIGFGIVMNSVYSIVHEAEHAMLFRRRRLNDGVGIAMALLFPAPFHLLRQGHLGHHQRNRSDDEAFDLYFDGDHVVWRWMVWYGILTGMYYVVVVLSNVAAVFLPFILDRRHYRIEERVSVDRPGAAFLESLNPRYVTWIRWEALAAIVLQVCIVVGFSIPIWRYLALYGSFGFMWSAMQYVHHYATERHVTRGARNLALLAPVDLVWLHHNWHRVHHEHPTVPWTYLPEIGQTESPEPRGFLPWYYLKMWVGPRRAKDRVQNKYAGRVIR
jgi:fatty acid desaturase